MLSIVAGLRFSWYWTWWTVALQAYGPATSLKRMVCPGWMAANGGTLDLASLDSMVLRPRSMSSAYFGRMMAT